MPGDGDVKELRLAVVCYGGASLAIYMHGVTKEINRLAVGSALREAGAPPAGEQPRTQHVYSEVLGARAERDQGVETRVVVDIVAGTSAGGINGVYLSKALAHNLSQDSLRDLWFERGDVNQLLLGPRFIPWKARLAVLLPLMLFRSPVRGGAMATWLHDALRGMDESRAQPAAIASLLPDGHLLELYVTITDFYGYDRQLEIAEPRTVHDQRHRHALAFRYRSNAIDDFGPAANAALAFAARTTSSFPGVFPAVSFDSFQGWVPSADLSELARRCFRIYSLAGQDPAGTQFIDGGVLDNKPFGWAIDAIVRRRADVEVERRLLYLEPDPGDAHLPSTPGPSARHPPPSPLKSILAAISKLPSHEPILDDLLAVQAHNERVQRLQDVIRTSFAPVASLVEEELGALSRLPDDPDLATLSDWNSQINARTIESAGLAYATYIRLKIRATVDRYARTVCQICDFPTESNHAFLVREAVRELGRTLGLYEECVTPTDAQVAFLRNFDLGYGQRRLLFVIAALRWWYRDLREGKADIPSRAQLDHGKQILYDAVERLRSTMGGEAWPDELVTAVGTAFPDEAIARHLAERGLDAQTFAQAHASQLRGLVDQVAAFNEKQLHNFSADLFVELNRAAIGWPAERRRDLLVRYLGFPLWDVLLFPIQSLAGAGEADEVEVFRMSPFEARLLTTQPEHKVKGVGFGHFAAFLDRAARENDYLWGRLDGAAILIGLLLGADHPAYHDWCLRAFAAVLDEEGTALTHVCDTVAALSAEVRAGLARAG
jgi:patatin-related protein